MILFWAVVVSLAFAAVMLLAYEFGVWLDHREASSAGDMGPSVEENSRPFGNVDVLREHRRGGT